MTSLIKFFFVTISFVVERLSWRIILGGTSESKNAFEEEIKHKKEEKKRNRKTLGISDFSFERGGRFYCAKYAYGWQT